MPLTSPMPRDLCPVPMVGGPADGEQVRGSARSILWGELSDGYAPVQFHRYYLRVEDDGLAYVYFGPVPS